MDPTRIKAHSVDKVNLGRNTVINFCGQLLVAFSALITVPLIVRHLGYSSYGLLSIALMVFGSFSILELGLGRATTKFVAEYLSTQQFDKIGPLVWTSLMMQLLIGLVGGALLALFVPTVTSYMHVEKGRVDDALKMLYIICFSAPLILGSSALRGALEGCQRFDIVNLVKIVLNLLTYVIPLLGAFLNLSVPNIVFLIFIARFIATLSYLFFCLHVLPMMKMRPTFTTLSLSQLAFYAGWVAVSNVIVPFLVQVDRYLIAALVTVASVSFYTIPFEILNGLWIIPASISGVLFPAFSSVKDDAHLKSLFVRPIKYIIIAMGPLVVLIAAFSYEILLVWQNRTIADNSSAILQVLVVSVFVNSLSWVPSNLLMGAGRPDVIAKIHIIQTPIYVFAAYLLILKLGVLGGAVAFAVRVTIEAGLVFHAALRHNPALCGIFSIDEVYSVLVLAGFSLFIVIVRVFLSHSVPLTVFLSCIGTALYAFSIWFWGFDDADRRLILGLTNRLHYAGGL